MISAIVLAAGESRRMGQPKMLLPWGSRTVLGQVIVTLREAGLEDCLVITGRFRELVDQQASDLGASTVYNPNYASGEMLSSIQIGLRALQDRINTARMSLEPNAALIVLGDQPQIQQRTVELVLDEYRRTPSALIVPSFNMHRGHPWLIANTLWDEFLHLQAPETPRDFLGRQSDRIHYLPLETSTILQDIDTPDDYLKSRP